MHGAHQTAPDHPCWHCRWWGGADSSGTNALCDRPRTARVNAQPETGCAFFEREVGADDEPEWAPVALVRGPDLWTPNVRRSNGGPVEWAP